MKVCSWLKSRTFQCALHMQSVDHLNIDGSPFPVKCVRKCWFALGGEITYCGASIYVYYKIAEISVN